MFDALLACGKSHPEAIGIKRCTFQATNEKFHVRFNTSISQIIQRKKIQLLTTSIIVLTKELTNVKETKTKTKRREGIFEFNAEWNQGRGDGKNERRSSTAIDQHQVNRTETILSKTRNKKDFIRKTRDRRRLGRRSRRYDKGRRDKPNPVRSERLGVYYYYN